MACAFVIEVPLGNEAIQHVPYDTSFGNHYEPTDTVSDWLDLYTGHYWYYQPWIGISLTGAQYYEGLRFYLPTEQIQLLFKLAWGGK